MKKVISFCLIAIVLFSLTACTVKEPLPENVAKLDSGTVEIKDYRLAEDRDGNAVVIITYAFAYTDEEYTGSFCGSVYHQVFQNGIGLIECEEEDVLESADYDEDDQYKELKAGAELDVEIAYTLENTTDDIEVEVSDFFSTGMYPLFPWMKDTATKTFSIA